MAFFVAIISAFALFMGVTARAQVLSYIIFLFEIYFIEMLIKSGKKRYIIYLMVMSLLLANIHATIWLFYFVLFLPFLGEHVIYLVVNKFEISVNNKLIINRINNIKLLIIGFIGSFIMGIFSPSRICYTYVFKIMLGDSQSFIQEHLPLVVIQNPLFIVIVLVLLLILIFSNTKIKLKELFMIGGLVLMSLISIRHILLFYLIGMLYISIICMRYLNDKNDKTLDILLSLIVKKKLIYILYFIVVLVLGYSRFNYNYNQSYINEEDYPVKAVKYIKNNINLEKFRIYNDYNFGSYLMLNDIPVFIDSRCDLYLKEFNNKLDIFDDAMDLYSNYNYDKFFKKYNVNYVLVSNKTILFKFLNKDNNYIKEYDDKYFTLFKLGSVVNDK
jgi:hypothetical protein